MYIMNTRFVMRYELVKECANMPVLKTNYTLIKDKDYIYVLGGQFQGQLLSCCHQYNVATDRWIQISDLVLAR